MNNSEVIDTVVEELTFTLTRDLGPKDEWVYIDGPKEMRREISPLSPGQWVWIPATDTYHQVLAVKERMICIGPRSVAAKTIVPKDAWLIRLHQHIIYDAAQNPSHGSFVSKRL